MFEGDFVGRYKIVEELAAGGMGVVYRAWDPTLQRYVALKLLAEHLMTDEDLNRRFDREARIVAGLQHPNIVPVYDVGIEDGRPFLVMGYVGGGTLRKKLETGTLTMSALWQSMAQVASALDAAHQQKIIHRDIKPNNILFDGNADAFVADFGIAKIADAVTQLTGQGILGTLAYMSPEQFKGDHVTGQSDQYSLATVIFEALTGQVPFDGETLLVMYEHVHVLPPEVHQMNKSLPAELTPVMGRALAKEPADRYETVSDFVTAAVSVNVEQGIMILPASHEEERQTPPLAILPVLEQVEIAIDPKYPVGEGLEDAVVVADGAKKPKQRAVKPLTRSRIVQGAGGEEIEQRRRSYFWIGLIAIALILFLIASTLRQPRDPVEAVEPDVVAEIPTETTTGTPAQTEIGSSETFLETEPTPLPAPVHTVLVRNAGPGSRWQAGVDEGIVASGASLPVPADSPLRILTGDSKLELTLPQGKQLILGSDSEVELREGEGAEDANALRIILFAGRLLLESEEIAVVENPFGANIRVENGIIGVSQSSSPYLFEADCLSGICVVAGDLGNEEPVELQQGEASQVGGSGRPGSPIPARYHNFGEWSDAVPTPTMTPTATNTPKPTPTSASTSTFTPRPIIPTFTPTPLSTPAVDSDGDGIPDYADQCPLEPGTADNGGCPPTS